MSRIALFGAAYSVYVRIPRLVLEEIGLRYDLVEIDIFTKESVPADYAARHPFSRIPAFEHDGFRLFETDAIVGYILDSFGDHRLVPIGAKDRARMRQIMRIMDNYAYQALVWGVYVEETERGRAGQLQPDEVERARTCLRVIEDLATTDHLAADRLTVADLWAYPMLVYLRLAPTGRALLADAPRLRAWLARMDARPSAAATRFPAEPKAG
jgi:glutathione S-transferase